ELPAARCFRERGIAEFVRVLRGEQRRAIQPDPGEARRDWHPHLRSAVARDELGWARLIERQQLEQMDVAGENEVDSCRRLRFPGFGDVGRSLRRGVGGLLSGYQSPDRMVG